MLSPNLQLGEPAFSALRPALPQARPVTPGVAGAICRALGIEGHVSRLTGNDDMVGGYKTDLEDGSSMFIKVVPFERAGHMRLVDDMTSLIRDVAADSCRAVEGSVDGYVVLAYPYVLGRRAENDPDDMYQVGLAIRRLHLAFQGFSGADAVRARTLEWAEHLERASRMAIGGQIDNFPDTAIAQLQDRPQRYTPLAMAPDAQVLHGDLNFGNILIRLGDGSAVVLDYENAIRSFGPPRLDLLFAMERFCFPTETSTDTQTALILSLLKGYTAACPTPPLSREEIEETLTVRSLRSLSILAARAAGAQALPTGEVEKFLSQLNDAPYKADTIARAFCAHTDS